MSSIMFVHCTLLLEGDGVLTEGLAAALLPLASSSSGCKTGIIYKTCAGKQPQEKVKSLYIFWHLLETLYMYMMQGQAGLRLPLASIT